MRYSGVITELDCDLDEYDFEISDVVVTKDRIAMDWKEDDELLHVVLRANDDGITYEGNYGSPQPDPSWKMEVTKYTAADNGILLLAKWVQADSGTSGSAIFMLEPIE